MATPPKSPARAPDVSAFALTRRRVAVLRAIAAGHVTRHENYDPESPTIIWYEPIEGTDHAYRHTVTETFRQLMAAGLVAVGAQVKGTRRIRHGPDRHVKLTTLGKSVVGDLERVAAVMFDIAASEFPS